MYYTLCLHSVYTPLTLRLYPVYTLFTLRLLSTYTIFTLYLTHHLKVTADKVYICKVSVDGVMYTKRHLLNTFSVDISNPEVRTPQYHIHTANCTCTTQIPHE